MRVALVMLMLLVLAGCSSDISANGISGNLYWSLTINNTGTAPSDGLVLVIAYSDGSSTTVSVPPGGMVVVPAFGNAVWVSGAGGPWQVVPVGGYGYLNLPFAGG